MQGSSRDGTWPPLCYLISGDTGSPKHSLQIVIREVGRMWSAAAAIRGTHLKTFIPLHAKAFPPTALSQVVWAYTVRVRAEPKFTTFSRLSLIWLPVLSSCSKTPCAENITACRVIAEADFKWSSFHAVTVQNPSTKASMPTPLLNRNRSLLRTSSADHQKSTEWDTHLFLNTMLPCS